MRAFIFFLTNILLFPFYTPCQKTQSEHDPQFIQIFYHFDKYNELDTFNGTFQKDLIPGLADTTMWLTTREQEIILTKVERLRFFSFHDTAYQIPNVLQRPDMGPQTIRIKYKDKELTIVWYYPIDHKCKDMYFIEQIAELIYDIIISKPEYKALPPVKGGCQ